MAADKKELIYHLILEEGLSQRKAAQRLGICQSRVFQYVQKLRIEGRISGGILPRKREGGVLTPPGASTGTQGQHFLKTHPARLHGQVFSARVLEATPRYFSYMKLNGGVLDFEGHKAQLFPGKLVIHAWPGLEFVGDDQDKAHKRSESYWLALLERLEIFLNIIIFKAGSTQIREEKAHYAEKGNEWAASLRDEGQRWAFKGGSGITWLITDFSNGANELEFTDPTLSRNDMAAVKPMLDDLRVNCPGMTFSRVLGLFEGFLAPPGTEKDIRKQDYIG